MDSELYQKFRNSPIRQLLRQVAANPNLPVRDDTLDDLNLGPGNVRRSSKRSTGYAKSRPSTSGNATPTKPRR